MWPNRAVTSLFVYVALFGLAALLVFVAGDTFVYVVKSSVRKARVTYRRMGRTRFFTAIVLWVMWGAVYAYLAAQTGWPDAYGAHDVTRGAYLVWLIQSPGLLRTGTFASDTLFVWIWVLLPAVIAFSFWHVPRKISQATRRRQKG